MLIFFKAKKHDEIDKFIFINNEKNYSMIKSDLNLKILSKNQKNLFIFKNKRTHINYKKLDFVNLRFENENDLFQLL